MSLPGWVEPGPNDERDGGGGEDEAGDGPTEGADGSADAGDAAEEELAVKPVLEWTNDDWARWIDGADARQLPSVEVAEKPGEGASGTAVTATESEPDVAPEAEADDEWSPAPVDAPEDDDEGGSEPVVATELEAVDAAGSKPEAVAPEDREAVEDWSPEPVVDEKPEAVAPEDREAVEDWSPEPVVAEQLEAVASEDPEAVEDWPPEPVVAEKFEAAATEPAEAVVPAGTWDVAGQAPSAEPSRSDQADDDSERDDLAAAAAIPAAPAADTAGNDDEWLDVADHPWWESAPVRDEPDLLDPDPVTRSETPLSGRVPRAEPSEVPATAAATERPSTSITRAMPANLPAGRGDDVVRRRPASPEPSHRVRSAFGLLGVAVTVGMVMAGLITVAIFAISLALRQAVG